MTGSTLPSETIDQAANAVGRPKILISESRDFSPQALACLRTIAEVSCADLSREELLAAAPASEILWIRLRHKIDRQVFGAAPHLKVIVSPTTGLNHIDEKLAAERGVKILSLRGEAEFLKDVRATAELTIGLIFALLRKIDTAARHAQAGLWDRDQFKGHELRGQTVGIVGYGRLGRIVARYLQVFDTCVLAADPHVDPSAVAPGVQRVELDELLRRSDLVSLHVNLCAETQGFFGQEQLASMKPGSRLINTARGELLDENAMLDALRSGHLAGAALDVLCNEDASGMRQHPLVRYAERHDNLVITPHIGGCTAESMLMTEEFLADKLLTWLDRERHKTTTN
jgi:D-3-phosphoglycerate dehydrogenase